MKFKIFMLFECFFIVKPAITCTCFPIESVSAKELMEEVEFVVIGRAVKNIGFNREVNSIWDQEKKGFDILFEVDSVLKGDVKSEFLIVKQFEGNCDQIFKFGVKYLVLGNELERFVNLTPKQSNSRKREIPESYIPPPPPSIYSKILAINNMSQKEVNFWNKKAKKNLILRTSMCSSFTTNSNSARYFLKK